MSPKAAQALLEQRSARLVAVPVMFVADGRAFSITPKSMGVEVDWHAAVAAAARQGGGVGVVRGYRRLELQLFPQNVAPPIRSYGAAVDYELGLLAHALDTPHRQAALVRRGLHITIAPGTTGRVLDRAAARALLVRTLASFSRAPVALPVRLDQPQVTVASLTANQMRASQIISGPVTVVAGPTRLRIPRWRLAKLLDLRVDAIRRPGRGRVLRPARAQGRPSRRRTRRSRSTAARSASSRRHPASRSTSHARWRPCSQRLARPTNRVATLSFSVQQPARSTAAAQAMGITGTVSTYETEYGGDPNRIHNVQLVAHLVDNKLIAPGATFSFNGTTGERSAEKGFLEAPVIVNGELADRPRRRRLPGLDDRLQRGVRGRAADHRAHESLALHLALPARPRRDRQLSRHRPQVRQRHRRTGCSCGRGSGRRRSPSRSTAPRSTAGSRRRPRRSSSSRRRP